MLDECGAPANREDAKGLAASAAFCVLKCAGGGRSGGKIRQFLC